MHLKKKALFILLLVSKTALSQETDPYRPDFSAPAPIPGMTLVWNDEFNTNGKPDPRNWRYETGFERNRELQWYQPDNANCVNGVLLIEGRREKVRNPHYEAGSDNWKLNREYAHYTSASVNTRGLRQFHFGRFEIRARIDTSSGAWPAIWTLGMHGHWPLDGEVDIMEFYRVKGIPTILANMAWGSSPEGGPLWNTKRYPLSGVAAHDPAWSKKFHIWRMDWSRDSINLYLDGVLMNTALLRETLNPDGSNPFLQPQYLLLNLALGVHGGDPDKSVFPIKYEVDYVRYYKKL